MQIRTMLDRLNRHDLSDEAWERLRVFLPYQKKHRGDRGRSGGRPPVFDASWYTKRNTVERCFGKLKQFRAVATRYDKRERIYQAPSTSLRSASGYATLSHDPRDTPWAG